VAADERAARLGCRPATLWLTGATESLPDALERRLFDAGAVCHVVGPGRTPGDGNGGGVPVAVAARLLNEAGVLALCAIPGPPGRDTERAAAVVGADRFLRIWLGPPPALNGHNPDLVLPRTEIGDDACVDRIVTLLRERGFVGAA
jgi:adenylylsulfate kinase